MGFRQAQERDIARWVFSWVGTAVLLGVGVAWGLYHLIGSLR
jgi:hypothetical protein